MITLKTPQELAVMRRSGQAVAELLNKLKQAARAGMTTLELDALAEEFILRRGGVPAFKGYHGYPKTLCTSVNEEVIHGIPSSRKLKDGDILSIDVGIMIDGYYGDAAVTVPIGKVSPVAEKLMRVTEEALALGISQAKKGNFLSDISHAVQAHVEGNGFSVVRDYVGHGIGQKMHEDPQVPNFGPPGKGPRLKIGMVLAIEPMVNQGGWEIEVKEDQWTAVTKDGKLSAHFEHSCAIGENGPEILTRIQ